MPIGCCVLLRHKPTCLVLLAFGFLLLVAPLLAPYDPMQTDTTASLLPPGGSHPLGTDRLGRDVWSRLLVGGQRTLGLAMVATGIAVLPGLLIGLAAASWRWVDGIILAFTNALLAFPGLLLALVVMTLLGQGALSVAIATGLALVAPFARVTRTAALSVRSMGYIEAARAVGADSLRIAFVHVLPNAAPTLLAYVGVTFSYALLNSAALNFLGLGGDLGAPDWGTMLFEGRVVFRSAPWVSLAPGLAISGVVYAVNRVVASNSEGDSN